MFRAGWQGYVIRNAQTLQKFFCACSIVTVGIFPVRIKFTVLLLKRHCLQVSNARYGQMALQNNPHVNISALQPRKLRKKNTKFRTETTKQDPCLSQARSLPFHHDLLIIPPASLPPSNTIPPFKTKRTVQHSSHPINHLVEQRPSKTLHSYQHSTRS